MLETFNFVVDAARAHPFEAGSFILLMFISRYLETIRKQLGWLLMHNGFRGWDHD
jgi:hypothetical protein